MCAVAQRVIVAIMVVVLGGGSVAARAAWGQAPAPSPTAASPAAPGTFLLTIFLRHDQSKTLGDINAHLRQTGFYTKFPPPGIEVVTWYVMMGIGQVVTLRVPAERLREVNRV